ncbi:hypothetical protein [Pleionea sp. CnH1-48]|uniref:hypothetical protein n=1 Tax=Pleionea sp. CnH1-48 TaxID=2954494 RepID=UPI00209781DB|nr:hypothetical protein [Pleionea sp. CnH1-48]MCO7223111.1 hypothetical protein [Pleionea sp. CnH1-48]
MLGFSKKTLPKDEPVSRWQMIRQLLIFQLKLAIDALRDILLSPLSMILTIMDLMAGNKNEKRWFTRLMHFGRDTDKAINLFNQHDADKESKPNVDRAFEQFEELLKKHYQTGDLSNKTKAAIDKSLLLLKKNNLNEEPQDKEKP